MYRNILLCTDGSAAAEVATEYAIWFAKNLSARIQVLHIIDVRILEGPLLADISGAFGAQPYSALLPRLQQIQREKAEMILAAAAQSCEKHGVKCTTMHETGNLTDLMLKHEQAADLVVLGQRGEHAAWTREMLGSSVERMVRSSIKPCLVTPEQFHEIKHLLLAYDGSAESKKALEAGLSLAVDLGAKVTILTVCQRETEEKASKSLQEAHQQALAQKLTVDAQLLHGLAETEILAMSDKIKADLIVMGAYGHTRIRELILGSTTAHVLRKARVPVLLARG